MNSTSETPGEPWLTDERWRTGVVRSTAGGEMRLFVVMAVIWNAFTIPMTWLVAVPEFRQGNHAAALIGVFVLAGLWLAYSAVTRVCQWRRFGRLSLILDPFPGALGGEVGGILEVPMQMLVREKVQVTLNCIHVTISGSKEKTRHESVVWRERGMIDPEQGRNGWRLRFRFAVPVDLPQSEPPSNNHHEWIVHLLCPMPGADLDRSFAVPVFPAGSSQGSRATVSFTPDEVLAQQVPAGVAQVIRNARGLSIDYPLRRNTSMGLMISIFGLVFMAFPVYIVHQMLVEGSMGGIFEGIFAGVGGLVALVFAAVGLFLLLAGVYLLGNTLHVTLGDGVRGVGVAKHLVGIMREALEMPAVEPSQVGR